MAANFSAMLDSLQRHPTYGKYVSRFRQRPVFYGGIALVALLAFFFLLGSLGGPEVIKNPEPLKWEGITAAPREIVKYGDHQEWKDVRVFAGGLEGTARLVEIGKDWAVISDASFPDVYVARQEFRGVRGGWAKNFRALGQIISNSRALLPSSANDLAKMPGFRVEQIIADNLTVKRARDQVSFGHLELDNCDLPKSIGKLLAKDIAMRESGSATTIKSISADRLELPIDGNLEDMVVRNMQIRDISAPGEGISIGQISQDMGNGKYKLEIDDFMMRDGYILAQLPNAPKQISGSAEIEAHARKNGQVKFDGFVKIDNLADISGDLQGVLDMANNDFDPGAIDIRIKDTGLVKILDPQLKGMIMMFGSQLFGNELGAFFSRPGRTLRIRGNLASSLGGVNVTVN